MTNTGDLANAFLNHHYPDTWARTALPELPDSALYAIDPTQVESLTENLQGFIAEVVAMILNAGSEREAVMENEELTNAIINELKGWSLP